MTVLAISLAGCIEQKPKSFSTTSFNIGSSYLEADFLPDADALKTQWQNDSWGRKIIWDYDGKNFTPELSTVFKTA